MSDEERLTALESTVTQQARLRAMMDKDQADLRVKLDANTRLLGAMATTQGEHSRMLTRLEDRVARVEDKVDQMRTDIAEVKVGQLVIVDKLDELMRR